MCWKKSFLFFVLILALLPVISAEKEPEVILDKWIIPKTNLTILGDTFYVRLPNDPTVLIFEKGNQRTILHFNKEEKTEEYIFKIIDMRFNINNLDLKNAEGTPLFGLIDNKTDEFLYSYRLQVKLLKPIIEIKHTINGLFSNNKEQTRYVFDVNQPLNVTTTIINHGIYEVPYIHKEPINPDFKILNYTNASFDKDNSYFLKEGTVKDTESFSYTIEAEDDIEQMFDAETTITYNDKEITFNERNISTIVTKTGLSLKNGFFNNKDYSRKTTYKEIGETTKYKVTLTNDREQNITADVQINFPEGIEASINDLSLYDGQFSKRITIPSKGKTELDFDLLLTKTGKHTINVTATARINNHLKKFTDVGIAEGGYRPLTPKVIFSEKEVNKTSNILMYLVNTNTLSTISHVSFIVDTQFGTEREVLEYEMDELDIPSTHLINAIEHRLTGNDSISIHGTFQTIYGEEISFGTKVTPEQGFDAKFDTIEETIMKENKFDMRYEEPENQPDFVSGMATFLDPNNKMLFVLPITFFALILGIQFIIRKFKK